MLGYEWFSAAGEGAPEARDGLVAVPFSWELVDAYHLMPRFADLRVRRGDLAAPSAPPALADRFAVNLEKGAGVQMVILHPFLMLDEDWFAGVRRLLGLIAELGRDQRAWVVPGGRFADWLGRGERE
jgi:hypothetical protein